MWHVHIYVSKFTVYVGTYSFLPPSWSTSTTSPREYIQSSDNSVCGVGSHALAPLIDNHG